MKKLFILILAITAIVLTTIAQNPVYITIYSPLENQPIDLSFSNYKTYCPYVMLKNELILNGQNISKSFEGSDYSFGFYSLKKSGDDADFKIIMEIQIIDMPLTKNTAKDSLLAVCTHSSKITVFDKEGNSVYSNELSGSMKSGEKGTFLKKEEVDKQYLILLKNNLNKIATKMASPFEQKYFTTLKYVNVPLLEFGLSFRNDTNISKTMKVIDEIKANAASGQNEKFISTIKKYMPYWVSLTNAPEGKKQENIKMLGFCNLMLSNLLLNDTIKANQIYSENPTISRWMSFKKEKATLAQLHAPLLVKNPVHPDNQTSTVTVIDLVDKVKYFIIKGKGVSSNGEQTGIFKIKRPENNSNGIYSLDRKDIDMIFLDDSGAETKTKISNYTAFYDVEGNDYIVRKTGPLGNNTYELYKSIKKNSRVSAYSNAFDQHIVAYFRKAGMTDLFMGKLFKETKSLAEYFSDCSILSEKILSKEIKTNDYQQICDIYEKCQ